MLVLYDGGQESLFGDPYSTPVASINVLLYHVGYICIPLSRIRELRTTANYTLRFFSGNLLPQPLLLLYSVGSFVPVLGCILGIPRVVYV